MPQVWVKVFNDNGELVGPVATTTVERTIAEWARVLTSEQLRITRRQGTEPPFCGSLLDNHREGVYSCICCGLPLFSSNAKFHSGTGWPSFFQPLAPENLSHREDFSHGMTRVEILCTRCSAHLGHLFADGPPPTGHRYCVNSVSLRFTDQADLAGLADPIAR